MIGLTRSGTGCFSLWLYLYGKSGRQRVKCTAAVFGTIVSVTDSDTDKMPNYYR